ncbi:hypothetical protein [Aquisalimonas sp.]|uniref:hypothetical protein n=1 Tax=Aquisalimonas sp. TaxID=1872621 RepID=UPI0025BDC8A7|nr:hypothetical protein [Aquisalimonas sp.]
MNTAPVSWSRRLIPGSTLALALVVGSSINVAEAHTRLDGINLTPINGATTPINGPTSDRFTQVTPVARRDEGGKQSEATGNILDHFAQVAEIVPEFGGLYFDTDGNIRVKVVNPDSMDARHMQDVLMRVFGPEILSRSRQARKPGKEAAVLLEKSDYPVLQLLDWFKAADRVLDVDGVWFTELDEQRNRLIVGVESPEIEKAVELELREARVPREAVIVKLTEPTRPLSHELRHRIRPAVGGIGIGCTVGFNATRGGVSGFVTNSHCTSVIGSVTGTPFRNRAGVPSDLIGRETVDPGYWDCKTWSLGKTRACRWSDSAFAQYESGVSRQLGRIARTHFWRAPGQGAGDTVVNHANPTMTISANANPDYPFKGEMIDKMGRTTGWTYGYVNRTCANVNKASTSDGRQVRLLCQDRGNLTAAPGDSGSPVFLWYGNHVQLLGVVWGGVPVGTGKPHKTWFSALWNIRQDLGTLTTN